MIFEWLHFDLHEICIPSTKISDLLSDFSIKYQVRIIDDDLPLAQFAVAF